MNLKIVSTDQNKAKIKGYQIQLRLPTYFSTMKPHRCDSRMMKFLSINLSSSAPIFLLSISGGTAMLPERLSLK